MDGFPFTAEEWSRVKEITRAILNATLSGDAARRASHLGELRSVLSELRARHGDHPVLLGTEADFADDPVERRELYQQALQGAEEGELVTYPLRTSLARVLLEDFEDPDHALAELTACEAELERYADEAERWEWDELVDECGRHMSQSRTSW